MSGRPPARWPRGPRLGEGSRAYERDHTPAACMFEGSRWPQERRSAWWGPRPRRRGWSKAPISPGHRSDRPSKPEVADRIKSSPVARNRTDSSGQVAILEQEEGEQNGCSTVQHAIAERRQNVSAPRDHRPGRDRRARVEEFERGQNEPKSCAMNDTSSFVRPFAGDLRPGPA